MYRRSAPPNSSSRARNALDNAGSVMWQARAGDVIALALDMACAGGAQIVS
jgi:hypothetical protein